MASSTDPGSSAATKQRPLYSIPCISSVVSRRLGIVLYLLGPPSESADASDGGVAHCMFAGSDDPPPDAIGVCGGVPSSWTDGIDAAGDPAGEPARHLNVEQRPTLKQAVLSEIRQSLRTAL